MGGSSLLFLYPPHPLLLHSTTNPVNFAPKARGSLVIRAVDGNRDHHSHSKHSQSSKEEIIALFNRIQSSISKGDAINRVSKDNNTSAESMLEVLHQSTTHQGKGKSIGTKTSKKILGRQKDSTKKEDERSQPIKSTRPPSKFTRRSSIPFISTPRDETQRLSESTRDEDDDDIEKQSNKFEEMKLAQLKQVAKLKGIKGYSKLNKGELLELLLRSL